MKTLLVLLALGIIGYLGWQKFQRGGPPPVIQDPVFGEMRLTTTIEGRELEMAVFARVPDMRECELRSKVYWEGKLANCPGCKLQPARCQDDLPRRYARLFDDVSIPSTYLSLTAGENGERDGRIVVYGLTDQEGAIVCDMMKSAVLQKYKGTGRCIPPSKD